MADPQSTIISITRELFQKAGVPVEVSWTEEAIPRLVVTSSENLSFFILNYRR